MSGVCLGFCASPGKVTGTGTYLYDSSANTLTITVTPPPSAALQALTAFQHFFKAGQILQTVVAVPTPPSGSYPFPVSGVVASWAPSTGILVITASVNLSDPAITASIPGGVFPGSGSITFPYFPTGRSRSCSIWNNVTAQFAGIVLSSMVSGSWTTSATNSAHWQAMTLAGDGSQQPQSGISGDFTSDRETTETMSSASVSITFTPYLGAVPRALLSQTFEGSGLSNFNPNLPPDPIPPATSNPPGTPNFSIPPGKFIVLECADCCTNLFYAILFTVDPSLYDAYTTPPVIAASGQPWSYALTDTETFSGYCQSLGNGVGSTEAGYTGTASGYEFTGYASPSPHTETIQINGTEMFGLLPTFGYQDYAFYCWQLQDAENPLSNLSLNWYGHVPKDVSSRRAFSQTGTGSISGTAGGLSDSSSSYGQPPISADISWGGQADWTKVNSTGTEGTTISVVAGTTTTSGLYTTTTGNTTTTTSNTSENSSTNISNALSSSALVNAADIAGVYTENFNASGSVEVDQTVSTTTLLATSTSQGFVQTTGPSYNKVSWSIARSVTLTITAASP